MKIMPVIITTREALVASLDNECSVIYIDEMLYSRFREYVNVLLDEHGYTSARKAGKHGIFFLRHKEDNDSDRELHEIYDPFEIL